MTDVEIDDDDAESTSLRAALDQALTSTPHLPRDRAMVMLARRYADTLDDAYDRLDQASEDEEETSRAFARVVGVIAKIGPRYEATLDKLGMSPGARPATRGGEPHGVDPASAALAALRSGETAPPGIDPAAHLDPAVTAALADD